MPETFQPHQRGDFLKPHPETVWPAPDGVLGDVEHALRYGRSEPRARFVEKHRLLIASALNAYRNLVTTPSAAKQLPGLRAAMRNGEQRDG